MVFMVLQPLTLTVYYENLSLVRDASYILRNALYKTENLGGSRDPLIYKGFLTVIHINSLCIAVLEGI